MSTICKNWTQWLKETRFSALTEEMKNQTMEWLDSVGNAVVNMAQIKPDDVILDIGCGTGLLGFKAMEVLERQNGSGKVIFSDKFADCIETCESFLKDNPSNVNCEFLNASCEDLKLSDNSVDKAMMRSVLVHIVDKQPAIDEVYRVLKPGGFFCAFEPIIRSNTRYSELINPKEIDAYYEFKNAEDKIMSDENDSLCNFDDLTLKNNLNKAGFSSASTMIHTIESKYIVTAEMVAPWFESPPSPDRPSMKERYMKFFDEKKVDKYISDIREHLTGKEISLKTNSVLIYAIK